MIVMRSFCLVGRRGRMKIVMNDKKVEPGWSVMSEIGRDVEDSMMKFGCMEIWILLDRLI